MPATPEIFVKDATRHDGLAYECRECHRARKLGSDKRTGRYAQMTPEQRTMNLERQRKYGRTAKGRAIFLRKAYARIDACDLTAEEIMDIVVEPCVHCGTLDEPRGLDRIDNGLPHIKGNVAPSCTPCNFARGDRFTFSEMKLIGKVIRQIMLDRNSTEAANEDSQPASSNPPRARWGRPLKPPQT